MISDGFPHFVHLVCEKVLWEVFQAEVSLPAVRAIDYTNAITAAVQGIEPQLRGAYERAVKKYTADYEEVLWATADHSMLSRRSSDIYASYIRLIERFDLREEALSRDKFNQRMNALKQSAAGHILKANRQGWYEFRENIMRGYVRLRAAHRGVELELDHPLLQRRFMAQSV